MTTIIPDKLPFEEAQEASFGAQGEGIKGGLENLVTAQALKAISGPKQKASSPEEMIKQSARLKRIMGFLPENKASILAPFDPFAMQQIEEQQKYVTRIIKQYEDCLNSSWTRLLKIHNRMIHEQKQINKNETFKLHFSINYSFLFFHCEL